VAGEEQIAVEGQIADDAGRIINRRMGWERSDVGQDDERGADQKKEGDTVTRRTAGAGVFFRVTAAMITASTIGP